MKKLATLAILAALVGSAHAAAISWGFGGTVYVAETKDATAVIASDYTGTMPWTLALVYVGQSQDSFSIDSLTSDSVLDTMTYSVTTTGKASAIGKWSPTTKTYSTTDYADNASFAVVLFDGTSTFDYVYAGTTAAGDAVTSTLTVSDMTARGSGSVFAAGSSTTSGVVVAAVPEPGVAALALLGIGMLIKRRRA